MLVLGIAASLRRESWNRKLLHQAFGILRDKEIEVEELDLKPIPMYNRDVEEVGFPKAVLDFRHAIQKADAVLIASPEYNNSMPGVLKNAIEWASRRPNVLDGKVMFVMCTTSGRSGGSRMHMHLSYSLEAEGAWVLHQPKVLLPNVTDILAADGSIIDPSVTELLDQAMVRLLQMARILGQQSS